MNAYHLAALPPILLTIAVPQLWPWALAVETAVLLLLAVDAREDRLDRKAAARMEARLTDPATATTVRVPLLRAVSGDPAVAEWAALLRATGDRL